MPSAPRNDMPAAAATGLFGGLKREVGDALRRMAVRAGLGLVAGLLWLIVAGFLLVAFVIWLSGQIGAVAACAVVAAGLAVIALILGFVRRRS